MAEYQIAANRAIIEYEIKKSRFIAWACPAADRNAALQELEQARLKYPDARHHCWAYLIGPPQSPSAIALSDDGEPSGTAGKPILNVLQHKQISNIMLIVTRYFGGIKLGAGGLVRAYSQAAQMAITELPTQRYVVMVSLEIQCSFAQEHGLRHGLNSFEAVIDDVRYTNQVQVIARVATDRFAALTDFLDNQQVPYRSQ